MAFIPKRSDNITTSIQRLPIPLTSYYDHKYPKQDLLMQSTKIFSELKITEEESAYLTKLQAESQVWWDHKNGRITSSNFKGAVSTSIHKPAKSVLNSIITFSKKNTRPKFASGASGMRKEHSMSKPHTRISVLIQQAYTLTLNYPIWELHRMA